MASYQYRKSRCGDKTAVRSYTGKTTSLYWTRALTNFYWVNRGDYYNDVTWAPWHLKSPVDQRVGQQVTQANNKGNIKHRLTGASWWESTCGPWFPITKDQYCGNHFHVSMPTCNKFKNIFLNDQLPFIQMINSKPLLRTVMDPFSDAYMCHYAKGSIVNYIMRAHCNLDDAIPIIFLCQTSISWQ